MALGLSSSDDDDIASMETSVASVSIYRKGDQMKPFLDYMEDLTSGKNATKFPRSSRRFTRYWIQ